jgi:hypothetical protein
MKREVEEKKKYSTQIREFITDEMQFAEIAHRSSITPPL